MNEDDLQCPMCFHSFATVKPLILGCGHSLCGGCVEAHVRKIGTCPTCRQAESRNPQSIPVNCLLKELAEWGASVGQERPYLLTGNLLMYEEEILRKGSN